MKESLKKSISLFSRSDQYKLYLTLLLKKFHIRVPVKFELLFNQCVFYLSFIERGVSFEKGNGHMLKAAVLVNKKKYVVFVRKNSSDLHALESVLVNGEYKLAVESMQSRNNPGKVTVIDAGGNIGLTTLYFFAYFPDAQYIIIEPDQENCKQLELNLNYNNVVNTVILQKALWSDNEPVVIENSFRDGKEWSLTVNKLNGTIKSSSSLQIEGVSLQSICSDHCIDEIELLKLDIEGAERFLFKDDSFLRLVKSRVKNMIIEIHDEFNIRSVIQHEMKSADFLEKDDGDVTFFQKSPAPIVQG